MEQRPPLALIVTAATLCMACLAFALGGSAAASAIADRYSGPIAAASGGALLDPQAFVLHLMGDALLIASALFIAWGAFWIVASWLRYRPWPWLSLGILLFVEANALLAVVGRTGLFWLAMYAGGGHDVSRFYVRHTVASDAGGRVVVGVVGNSQAGSQIDERMLSDALQPDAVAAQLNFPAAKPFTLLLLRGELERAGVEDLVLYVSELSFYRGAGLDQLPLFASPSGMRAFYSLGGEPEWDEDGVRNGWVAAFLPGYRYRAAISERLFGKPEPPPFVPPPGVPSEEVLSPADLDTPEKVALYRFQQLEYGDTVAFQWRALEAFARGVDKAGIDLYLVPGTVQPMLAEMMDPAIRPEMLRSLRQLAARYDRVHYIEEERLPRLGNGDFKDPAHANKRGQALFTAGLADVLSEEMRVSAR